MTLADLKSMLAGQFGAALAMFTDCVEKCPDDHWDTPVAKYPFWLVTYHTLYCTDLYLSRSEDDFTLRPDFHPGGRSDLEDEYPSRRFEKRELLTYTAVIKAKAQAALESESLETLLGDSGFPRRNMSRAELYIYTLRHIEHHTGQLSAIVRKAGGDPRWVSRGWE